ncbi:MAG TPA: DUF2303 family protein [Xanthobacteraceae bacterium]|nr:DUF2303 family protein [Xanthobacteraceae bacterium]
MNDDEIPTKIDELLSAGEAAAGVTPRVMWLEHPEEGDTKIPLALEHQGDGESRVVVLDKALESLDARRTGPPRRKGTTRLSEVDSFIAHLLRWGSTATVIYADTAALAFTAVLDDHPPGPENGDTAWREHRAHYACPRSAEWKAWTEREGKPMAQGEFGDWIESRLEDLVTGKGKPAPTEILMMARQLHIRTKGTYERVVDPTSGDYSMVSKSETEPGSTVIHRAFDLAIPVFEGGGRYQLEARVRFVIPESKPAFTFILHRRAEIERDAFMEVRAKVANETKMLLLAGTP